MDTEQVIEILQDGGVGVLRTDTLYGLVGSALASDTVERIYTLKKRDINKPVIVLIPEIEDVERFGVIVSDELREQLSSYWPGAYSIVLPTIDEEFEFLSRGTDTIAFRVPDNEELRELLRETGPLVAPSANTEGNPPSTSIEMAQKYFFEEVDFYLDGGEVDGEASTLIRMNEDGVEVLRD